MSQDVPHPSDRPDLARRQIGNLLLGAVGLSVLGGCDRNATAGESEHVAQALSGKSPVKWVDTVLGAPPPSARTGDLASSTASAIGAEVVIARGCVSVGDGGGGIFYWDPKSTAADDGGLVIQPSGVTTGRWKRIVGGPLNVRWFGALGDGRTDDTVAIQRALDIVQGGTQPYARGNTVTVPTGTYRVTAPRDSAALWIRNNNVSLVGEGTPPYGTRIEVVGPGSGIVIEGCAQYPAACPAIARGSQIRNIHLTCVGTPMRDGIVVHAHSVSIADCCIAGAARHGILIESGEPANGSLIGATQAPRGAQFNVNNWTLRDVYFESCGDKASQGNPVAGCAVEVHGSDAQAGVATGLFAYSGNVGFCDESLGGNTWIGCYSEACFLGYRDGSAAGATFIACNAETATLGQFAHQPGSLAVGGSLAEHQVGATQRIGRHHGRLTFSNVEGDDQQYTVAVPGDFVSAIDIYRGGSIWNFAYEPTPAHWPFMQKSWRWYRRDSNGLGDPSHQFGDTGIFGWTDVTNPRGGSLPFIVNPLMNTARRWSHRQTDVTLQPGANIIYAWGGTTDAGSFEFGHSATDTWSKAQTRLNIEVEYANLSDMASADVRVAGYTLLPKGGCHRNFAAKLVNAGPTPITVTLVWHCEIFVSNFDGFPPG